MKKILTLLVFIATMSIFALLSFGLDLHALFSGMFAGSVSWIVALIFYENVKDEKIKNLIKKLFAFLLICTLLSSCNVYLNCNINKTQQLSKRQIDKHNKQAEKQTELQESIWY